MVSGYTKAQEDTLLSAKAPNASPALTGTPTAPTAAAGTNSSQLATTAFVTAGLAIKAPIASPTFTGTVSGITKSMVGLGNVDNTADLAKFSAFGVVPTIFYSGTSWPARTVLAGYTGPVEWNSERYTNAPSPTAMVQDDVWARVRAS